MTDLLISRIIGIVIILDNCIQVNSLLPLTVAFLDVIAGEDTVGVTARNWGEGLHPTVSHMWGYWRVLTLMEENGKK